MVDASYVPRLFQIESGGDPNARTGSNRGLGQFSPDLEKRYGITDQNRTDPAAQSAAVEQEAGEHAPRLAKVLGRDPSSGELYLGHQQGLAGASALLSNPDMPAWRAIRPYYKSDAVAKSAIWGNVPDGTSGFSKGLYPGGVSDVTARDFTSRWVDKFERGIVGNAPAPSSTAVAQQGPGAGAPAPVSPPNLGMLAGADLSEQQNQPNFGLLAQRALSVGQPQQQDVAPLAPINYPMPPAMRARLAAAALGRIT